MKDIDQIETERLILRKMHPEDLDSLLAIFTDPKVMASFGGYLYSRQDMQNWLQRNLEHQEQYGYGLFSVIYKANGLLVGDCGLEHMEMDRRPQTELGYDFRSDYWNRGFATEAASAVRDFAFETLKLPHLISMIRTGNMASRRVAEKIGMHLEREITRYEQGYWIYSIQNEGHS